MVSEIKDFMFAAFWVVTLSLESFNNGQKPTIVSFVLSFDRNHFSRIVGHQVPLAQVGKLTQHSANTVT